ncbi:glycoside hydrolase family 78 protein, partial [Aureobasidium melanogenum]
MAKIKVSRPIIEHDSHHDVDSNLPIHTGHRQPRLSWRFEATDHTLKGWHQTSYKVKLSAWGQPHPEICIESSESVLVPWPGKPLSLESSCRVKLRVEGEDESGEVVTSLWSEETAVEFVPSSDHFTANFISSAQPQSDGPLRPLRFRKAFTVPDYDTVVDKAKLYVSAYGVYQVSINGQRVGSDEMAPGWTSYTHRHLYQTHDVRNLLRPGGNVIGIEIAEGWYAGRLGWAGQRHLYGNILGAFAQLEVVATERQDAITIITDETWKCGYGPLINSSIYDGELYDAREERTGWTDDPDLQDSDWIPTKVLTITAARFDPSDVPPVKVTQHIKPERIFQSKSGKTIIDFGQNLVGKLFVKSLHKAADHKIVFRHAEVMEDGELGVRPLRSAAAIDTIISNGNVLEKWSPRHTFHGFRYAEVEGWTPSDRECPLTLDSIEALVMHTDMKRTGWFSCSDPLVNQLHENTVWSMRGNFLSIPTDCPQRDERLGWTGDIQVFGPSANFLFDTGAMLGHWLEDVAAEQAEHDGIPPFVVPNILASDVGDHSWGKFPQAVWDDVVVLLPWSLYRAFGDIEILKRQYPSMQMWLDKGIRRGTDDLWDPSFHQLGDWLDPSAPPDRPGEARTDGTFVADAYLVHATRLMSVISDLLGHKGEAARYTLEHKKLKKAFGRKYITIEGLPVATGFAGTPIITHALSSVGLQNLAYRMLFEKECPSWLYPITMGATTVWERWNSMLPDGSINPGEMTSFNHYALGSIVNWLHEVVGGISPLETGWKHSLIRPVPGGSLTHAEVKHGTPYGILSCKWSINAGQFRLSLTVPPNTTAKVVMPDKQASTILGEREEGIEVGSGAYEFSCAHEPERWEPTAIPIPFFIPIKKEPW